MPRLSRPSYLGFAAALILAVALGVLARGDTIPPPAAVAGATSAAREARAPDANAAGAGTGTGERRDAAAVDADALATRVGFCGRVVDAAGRPAPGADVRIDRQEFDAILAMPADASAHGAARTRADGTFAIAGIRPRGLYLLAAARGAATAQRLLPHAPAPGEVVDLGDIALGGTATVTGTIVDDDGHPVEGALVCGADLPGELLASFPCAGLQPDGLLLLASGDVPARVLELPAWLAALFARLPSARSDAAGAFRLAGLPPGSNVVAAAAAGFLTCVRTEVAVQAGQTLLLDAIMLQRGSELAGRVVDGRGRPVAGAEVVAGVAAAPGAAVAARRIGTTDAAGRFSATGFRRGLATVGARRAARDPWSLAAPQPAGTDLVVTLAAPAALTVRVVDPAGRAVAEPRVEVLAGGLGSVGAPGLPPLPGWPGRPPAVDLEGRVQRLPDGALRIADLPGGDYTVLAAGATAAAARAEVRLSGADEELVLRLPPAAGYRVRVLDPSGAPVRGAEVCAQESGGRDEPFFAGCTGDDGWLVIAQAGGEELTVSAEHPRWGAVHGHLDRGDGGLVLRMLEPGSIDGALRDHGEPPAPGTCMVVALQRPGVRGPTGPAPLLAAPGPDGSFALRALPPGRYRLGVLRAGAASAAGALARLLPLLAAPDALPGTDVTVAPGQVVRVDLELGPAPPKGPVARLYGTAQVDGRAASGCEVVLTAGAERRVAVVDAAGAFDFGPVPAAGVLVGLVAAPPALALGTAAAAARPELWRQRLGLLAGEQRELRIDVLTTAITGTVMRADRTPAAHVVVQALAQPLEDGPDGGRGDESFHAASTGEDGSFRFERLPAGEYRFEVRTDGEPPLRGSLAGVRAGGGARVTGLCIVLAQASVVAGRVDTSTFGRAPDYLALSFWTVDREHQERLGRQAAIAVAAADGAFATAGLEPGTYVVRIRARLDGWREFAGSQRIEVPPEGVRDLVVRPVPWRGR